VEGGCACGEDFQAFPEVGVGGGLGQGVGGGELFDASAVDEEPQRVDGVGPWGEAAGAFTGADGAAMSCEFAGEPLCGGPVDGQDIGIGDNGRHGTPWVRLGDVSTFSIYQGVSLYAKASRSRSASITLPGIPHCAKYPCNTSLAKQVLFHLCISLTIRCGSIIHIISIKFNISIYLSSNKRIKLIRDHWLHINPKTIISLVTNNLSQSVTQFPWGKIVVAT